MMKGIETHYAGRRFRSRGEARWAVFFDSLRLLWEYEPQGFELDHDGRLVRYLPDFWLPELSTWFEVKGHDPDRYSYADKCWLFAAQLPDDQRLVMATGPMPTPTALDCLGQPYEGAFDLMVLGDHHYAWCICPVCGKPGIEFDARGARVCHQSKHKDLKSDKSYSGDHPRIVAAYTAALSARFEHGEVG